MNVEASRFGVELSQREDGAFVVTRDAVELIVTRVRTLAEITFNEAVEGADPMREVRARERAFFDMQRARSDSFARRAAAARKSGGRGGRGGV